MTHTSDALRPSSLPRHGCSINNTEWNESDDDDLKATEVLLAYAWKSFEAAGQHFTRIDTKAGSLAGFVGVSATILVSVSRVILPMCPDHGWIYVSSRCAFALLLTSLFIAFALCLRALYPRRLTQLPQVPIIVGLFFKMDADKRGVRQLQKHIISQIGLAEGSIYEATRQKEGSLRRAASALWSALAFAIICFVSYSIDTIIDAYVR